MRMSTLLIINIIAISCYCQSKNNNSSSTISTTITSVGGREGVESVTVMPKHYKPDTTTATTTTTIKKYYGVKFKKIKYRPIRKRKARRKRKSFAMPVLKGKDKIKPIVDSKIIIAE